MSTAALLSPVINHHQSIMRRSHINDGQCRTVPYQRRRQSLAAMQSNTRYLPPTPCKSNYKTKKKLSIRNKLSLSGKTNNKRKHKNNHYNSSFMPRSRTPSPNKKRRMNHNTQKKQSQSKQRQNYYKNLGMIGIGSFSHVFKVKNAYSNKIFAIKQLLLCLNTRYHFFLFLLYFNDGRK